VDQPPLGDADPLGPAPERPLLGFLAPQASERLGPGVREAFEAALGDLEAAGAAVEPVELGDLGPTVASLRAINLAEPALDHAQWLRARPGDYGEDVRARLEAGARLTAVQYLEAQRHRGWVGERLRPALERFDALLTPTAPLAAPPLGTRSVDFDGGGEPLIGAAMRFNALPALAGLPAASVPCGFDGEGLPVGMQIFARRFCDLQVLRLARRYQEATDWHRRTPPLP
jgi:aspartyl-tRNA(Asn)/glutamyl-tRNA(Gln) amidotransferase subunit A